MSTAVMYVVPGTAYLVCSGGAMDVANLCFISWTSDEVGIANRNEGIHYDRIGMFKHKYCFSCTYNSSPKCHCKR
jgi:hypothetical protein